MKLCHGPFEVKINIPEKNQHNFKQNIGLKFTEGNTSPSDIRTKTPNAHLIQKETKGPLRRQDIESEAMNCYLLQGRVADPELP